MKIILIWLEYGVYWNCWHIEIHFDQYIIVCLYHDPNITIFTFIYSREINEKRILFLQLYRRHKNRTYGQYIMIGAIVRSNIRNSLKKVWQRKFNFTRNSINYIMYWDRIQSGFYWAFYISLILYTLYLFDINMMIIKKYRAVRLELGN